MNRELLDKVLEFDFQSLFKKKGYAFFTKGDFNLNIIGVRSKEIDQIRDEFNDILIVLYKNNRGDWTNFICSVTTDPSLYYLKNPMNKEGTAILVPNQYRGAFKLGLHKGKYEALVQAKALKVYRDKNRDSILDYNPSDIVEQENIGINIHGPYKDVVLENIEKYSAGCTVFNNYQMYRDFINLCKQSSKIYGNSFTYTLLKEEDLSI